MSSNSTDQRRQRIIKHMNDDHQESLALYLQVYAEVPATAAKSGCELIDVSLSALLIRAGNNIEYTVRFAPPLDSWGEIRPRLVEMDELARAKLGIPTDDPDSIIITEYLFPKGVALFVLCCILFYFFCYFNLQYVVPGSRSWNVLVTVFPGGPSWFRWIVKLIFWPVIAIHTTEAIVFDRTRMQKNGVKRFSGLWWLWVGNCWLEGATAWQRVDALIATKKEEKRLKKH